MDVDWWAWAHASDTTPGACWVFSVHVHTGPSQSDPFYAAGGTLKTKPGRPVTPGAQLTFHI